MLDVASLFAIFCAILVIVSKNPIVSALFLIGLFLSISCYLIMLGINFIGLSYLLVYVGAVKEKTLPCKRHAALVKLQLHKVLLIIVNFYSVVYKNVLFNMIIKCLYTIELILVNYFVVILHYFSPFLHTATSLNSLGSFAGKAVLHFSVSSSALKRTDVLVIKKYDEGIKPNLEDLKFIN